MKNPVLSFTLILTFFSLLACTTAQGPLSPILTDEVRNQAQKIAQSQEIVCDDVACFGEKMRQKHHFSDHELQNFFDQARVLPKIVSIMNRPGTSQPWYVFERNNVAPSMIKRGRAFRAQHRGQLKRIANQYGVPEEIILAILGIETNYGANQGNFRVADTLTTLAFHYPKRAAFFQGELEAFLLLAKEREKDPFAFKGSYAGAMGMPQFMPSSYRLWAVDDDQDGFANIWSNPRDIMASVAYYLKEHGWQTNGLTSIPVRLSDTADVQDLLDRKTALDHTFADLKKRGVLPLKDLPKNADQEPAVLYQLEISPGTYAYFVGFNNYYTIWRYNHSPKYVHAVLEIAQRMKKSS